MYICVMTIFQKVLFISFYSGGILLFCSCMIFLRMNFASFLGCLCIWGTNEKEFCNNFIDGNP